MAFSLRRIVVLTLCTLAAFANADGEELEGDGVLSIRQQSDAPSRTAPDGWKVSWTSNERLSTAASTGFLSQTIVDASASSVDQTHVDSCVDECASQTRCGFVNLLKLSGSRDASIVCLLFPRYMSAHNTLSSAGPAVYGGKVEYSYGIRSTCAPTSGKALTCTPAKKNISSSSISASATLTSATAPTETLNGAFRMARAKSVPSAPKGATLVDWIPDACKHAKLSVPAMINKAFLKGSSSATTAYVSQHGAGSDFDDYFTYLYKVVGDDVPLISAGFMPDDGSNDYYQAGVNLAWDARGDSWVDGEDDTTGAGCSSFDMYDTVIDYLATSGHFPKVKTLYFVGHSGGGNMISRFSTINSNNPFTVKYVVANAANQAYFTDDRPISTTSRSVKTCRQSTDWPFQWTRKTNRYVGKRFDGDAKALFTRWRSRSVVQLTGDRDIDTSGTQSCSSQSQGGYYRRDRNYAYWAYENILAGTKTDVSKYYGYQDLVKNGAKQITDSPNNFAHQQCTVSGVGHDASAMFRSACGRAAIFGKALPAGAGASYPLGTLQSERNSTVAGLLNTLAGGLLGRDTQDDAEPQSATLSKRGSRRGLRHHVPQKRMF